MPGEQQDRIGAAMWAVADAVVLMLLSALAGWVVVVVHERFGTAAWAFLLATFVGMFVPMLVAQALSGVLGSIETMVPAMLGGMITMTAVCAAGLVAMPTRGVAAAIGVAVGAAITGALRRYAATCPARLRQDVA